MKKHAFLNEIDSIKKFFITIKVNKDITTVEIRKIDVFKILNYFDLNDYIEMSLMTYTPTDETHAEIFLQN